MVLYQVVLHTLSHAAEYPKNGRKGLILFLFGATFFLQRIECFEPMIYFVFRILTNTAGIKEDSIGLFLRFAYLVAGHLHHRRHHFAVGHIHLATVGFDI